MCPIFPVFTLPRPALAPPFSCMRKLFFAFGPRVDGSLLRSVRRSLARYIFLMQRESAKLGKYTLHYFHREREYSPRPHAGRPLKPTFLFPSLRIYISFAGYMSEEEKNKKGLQKVDAVVRRRINKVGRCPRNCGTRRQPRNGVSHDSLGSWQRHPLFPHG